RQALALADQPEQDVLGADPVVLEADCFAQRQLEHLLRPRSERPAGDLAAEQAVPGGGHLRRQGTRTERLLDLRADGLDVDTYALQRLGIGVADDPGLPEDPFDR